MVGVLLPSLLVEALVPPPRRLSRARVAPSLVGELLLGAPLSAGLASASWQSSRALAAAIPSLTIGTARRLAGAYIPSFRISVANSLMKFMY